MPLLPIALGIGLLVLLTAAKAGAGQPSKPGAAGGPFFGPGVDCIPLAAEALTNTFATRGMSPEQLGHFATSLEVAGHRAAANCLRAILQGAEDLDCIPLVRPAIEQELRTAGAEKLETYALILHNEGQTVASDCLLAAAKQRRAEGR